ncbi:MAG: hypothetical protein MUF51_08495 [Vicinamibacteria bacterium]|nr:hypothetical protein [Vicinamibacteria bacterium]
MQRETQISAVISVATKVLLERQVRSTGMKKGRVIENALRHHLLALQELPADVVVHPRLVISRRSGQELLARIKSTKPTKALKELMARRGD